MNRKLFFTVSLIAFLSRGGFGAEATAPQKPWLATGTVVDQSGAPMDGVEIYAHTGIGSLLGGGRTTTKADGTFELRFGPGFSSTDPVMLQAATISPHKKGWFEANLHRQGDLLAALMMPVGEIGWGGKTTNDIFLPGQPKSLKFTLRPAAQISGILLDDKNQPLANTRVGVTGPELRPSSSVFADMKTNEKGEFNFEDMPTGYKLIIFAESGENWRAWPNVTVILPNAENYNVRISRGQVNLSLSSKPWLEVLERNTRRK